MDDCGLCFSGGGVLGICYAGVIEALHTLDVFKHFKHFSGASAGSIAAALASFNTSPSKLKHYLTVDFNEFLDDDYGIIRDCTRLWYEMGYYKGEYLHKYLKKIFDSVTGISDITFLQAYNKYGTTLTLTGTKVYKTHCKIEYFSYETTPEMDIATACRISCTYPLMFKSLKGYTDGGVLDNYPIETLKCHKRYGIAFQRICDKEEEEVSNASEYVSSILSTLHDKVNACKYDDNTLLIPVSICSTKFSLTEEEKIQLFDTSKELALKRFSLFSH